MKNQLIVRVAALTLIFQAHAFANSKPFISVSCFDKVNQESFTIFLESLDAEGNADVSYQGEKMNGTYKLGVVGGQTRLTGATTLEVSAQTVPHPSRAIRPFIIIKAHLYGYSGLLWGSAEVTEDSWEQAPQTKTLEVNCDTQIAGG